MEKYNLHMRREVFDRVSKCMSAHIEADKWFPVKVLGDLMEVDLSNIFGNGDLGWSPATLSRCCQSTETGFGVYVSVPRPEELPDNAPPAPADPMIALRGATCFLRHLADAGNRAYMPAELVNQLSEMRTLIHALIGTGENCCDATISESAEDVRKAARLDAMDAFSYAIRALLDRKDEPGIKRALNSSYGTAVCEGIRLSDALKNAASASMEGLRDALYGSSEGSDSVMPDSCECENVRSEEPNALFVTIETDMFEATPENVAAVNSYITNAGEGRDIHLRII